MNTFLQDLRYGLRMLLKNRGFTLASVLTLALGLGANLTIFSFVDTVFLRPLPVQKPYQLATVTTTRNGELVWEYAYPEYAYFRDHNKSFEALAAHYSTSPLFGVSATESNNLCADCVAARRGGVARMLLARASRHESRSAVSAAVRMKSFAIADFQLPIGVGWQAISRSESFVRRK